MKKFMHKSLYRKTGSARVLSCFFAFVMVILGLSHPMTAKADENVIIPINMRDGIILGTGLGNEEWNCSAPHGSGRIYNDQK